MGPDGIEVGLMTIEEFFGLGQPGSSETYTLVVEEVKLPPHIKRDNLPSGTRPYLCTRARC